MNLLWGEISAHHMGLKWAVLKAAHVIADMHFNWNYGICNQVMIITLLEFNIDLGNTWLLLHFDRISLDFGNNRVAPVV